MVADDDASLETVVVDGLGLADVVVEVDNALLEGAYDDVVSPETARDGRRPGLWGQPHREPV